MSAHIFITRPQRGHIHKHFGSYRRATNRWEAIYTRHVTYMHAYRQVIRAWNTLLMVMRIPRSTSRRHVPIKPLAKYVQKRAVNYYHRGMWMMATSSIIILWSIKFIPMEIYCTFRSTQNFNIDVNGRINCARRTASIWNHVQTEFSLRQCRNWSLIDGDRVRDFGSFWYSLWDTLHM